MADQEREQAKQDGNWMKADMLKRTEQTRFFVGRVYATIKVSEKISETPIKVAK